MDHDAEYKLSIQNYSGQPGGRFYSLVAALPHIERLGHQPPAPQRTICYTTAAPIPAGGQDAVTIYGTYYAVIGERVYEYTGSGSETVVWKDAKEVRLGRPGAGDGSVVEAHCRAGMLSVTLANTAPDDDDSGLPAHFQAMALPEETSRRLLHHPLRRSSTLINNEKCVLAAVPYEPASEYILRVRKGFLVTMLRGRVGQVLPDTDSAARHAHPVWFPGYQRGLALAEDHAGMFQSALPPGTEYPTRLELDTAPLGWEPSAAHLPAWAAPHLRTDPRRTNTHPAPTNRGPPQPLARTPSPPAAAHGHPRPASPDDEDGDANATGASVEDEDPLNRLRDWDTVLLIDDSGSMAGARWNEAKELLEELAPILTNYDADGIDVYFLNHISKNAADPTNHPGRAKGGYLGKQNADEVDDIFEAIGTPNRHHTTPTGRRLRFIMKPYLALYETALASDDEDDIKPLSVIIITDGEPTDNLEQEIVRIAKQLDKLDAPSGQVGLQFFQIGNECSATKALKSLDDDLENKYKIRDMVDTVTWGPDRILSADLIVHLVLGAMVRKIDRREQDG